ncbi:hypothetical protein [Micromonospora sp. NPDC005324]|uniref:hypothetical protein n=1 Tax=Micromonospora sp. NPDC005324 TaxID=3157033 RepID=UPI00339FA410
MRVQTADAQAAGDLGELGGEVHAETNGDLGGQLRDQCPQDRVEDAARGGDHHRDEEGTEQGSQQPGDGRRQHDQLHDDRHLGLLDVRGGVHRGLGEFIGHGGQGFEDGGEVGADQIGVRGGGRPGHRVAEGPRQSGHVVAQRAQDIPVVAPHAVHASQHRLVALGPLHADHDLQQPLKVGG